jgi:hypothetical protein
MTWTLNPKKLKKWRKCILSLSERRRRGGFETQISIRRNARVRARGSPEDGMRVRSFALLCLRLFSYLTLWTKKNEGCCVRCSRAICTPD